MHTIIHLYGYAHITSWTGVYAYDLSSHYIDGIISTSKHGKEYILVTCHARVKVVKDCGIKLNNQHHLLWFCFLSG